MKPCKNRHFNEKVAFFRFAIKNSEFSFGEIVSRVGEVISPFRFFVSATGITSSPKGNVASSMGFSVFPERFLFFQKGDSSFPGRGTRFLFGIFRCLCGGKDFPIGSIVFSFGGASSRAGVSGFPKGEGGAVLEGKVVRAENVGNISGAGKKIENNFFHLDSLCPTSSRIGCA
jgi:hypothetical protein